MSTDMQSEMNKAVTQFVSEVTEIAKRAARSQLDAAFGEDSGRTTRGSASSGNRGKGIKRDPSDLVKLGAQFKAFVKANPGMRIEQINAKLGTNTKDLRLPIKKLVDDGEVKVKGKKRSTTYMVA